METSLAKQTAAALKAAAPAIPKLSTTVGLDGFVDTILHVRNHDMQKLEAKVTALEQQLHLERCNRDLNALLNDKEVADRIATIGPLVDGSMNADAVGAFLKAETTRWQAATKEIGVLPE